MASASRETVEVTNITLTLTEEEASTLKTILGRFLRKELLRDGDFSTTSIYYALADAGVKKHSRAEVVRKSHYKNDRQPLSGVLVVQKVERSY